MFMRSYAPNTHALLDIRGRDTVAKTDDELRNLLDVDDILVLLVCTLLTLDRTRSVDRTRSGGGLLVNGDNLGATSHL